MLSFAFSTLSASSLQKRVRQTSNPGTTKRVKTSNDTDQLLEPSLGGTQDINMSLQSRPYKPDNKERDGYYYGFAGNPRLVARTSDNRWSEPRHETGNWSNTIVRTRKQYRAIIKHEIISKWSKDLSFAIIKALELCAWSYFFPVQIGPEDTRNAPPPQTEFSTVLLVAVEEGSLQWEHGINIALKCRDILRSFQISDVEVEIREGMFKHQAASTKLEAQVDPKTWHTSTNQAILPMLSYPGYPIGYFENINGQGTVGLHLKLQDENATVYALTCRHVVCSNRAPHASYTTSEEHRQFHVQASDTGFSNCLKQLESIQETLEWRIQPLQDKKTRWDDWYSTDETMKHKCLTKQETDSLQRLKHRAAYNSKFVELLKTIKEKEKRRIGHLSFHSDFNTSSQRPGYLKDWALVELDPDKFISGPENKVFVGNQDYIDEEILDNGFLSLNLNARDEDEVSMKAFEVGKQGAQTGLTFGIKSGIEAVVRRPAADGKPVYTWELLIVPTRGTQYFSREGDSGSSIFDLNGRVVGLVVGSTNGKPDDVEIGWRGFPTDGSSNPRQLKRYPADKSSPREASETDSGDLPNWADETDVTFAAPIQWVLEDIHDFTGQQPRLV